MGMSTDQIKALAKAAKNQMEGYMETLIEQIILFQRIMHRPRSLLSLCLVLRSRIDHHYLSRQWLIECEKECVRAAGHT